MNAKEMFEKLGYERDEFSRDIIAYSKNNFQITFRLNKKDFEASRYFEDDSSIHYFSYYLNHDEFQAITQQMKELGWIE
ncbi:MAG: hypothetical protein RBS13_06250 [Bacteroidales bacterium]|jgi:hypothetical protein|nr:hypothetical protein [Bacteroidales bacterium]